MCRYKTFAMISDLVDYINHQGIEQKQIVNITYKPHVFEYVLVYFT